MHRGLLTVAIICGLAACEATDGRLQGTREPCATASGTLLGCDDTVIETPEDACFRLVHCGAIPLDSDEDYVFDWDRCVFDVQRLPEYRYDLAIACIQNSSCDELKDDSLRSPDRPPCIEFGSQ